MGIKVPKFKGDRNSVYPYVIPLTKTKHGSLDINWDLIDKVIGSIQSKLVSLLYAEGPSRDDVLLRYGLDQCRSNYKDSFETSKATYTTSRDEMSGIWDDPFTGVRYVKL